VLLYGWEVVEVVVRELGWFDVVTGTPVARAAKLAASTVLIFVANMGAPVGSGLVASLSRPDGT